MLRDAYAQATSGQSEEYEQARTQCVESDEVIRDYLGVDAEDGGLSIDGETSDGASASIADATTDATADPAVQPAGEEAQAA